MCRAQRDVYLSKLLCLGYIGAFMLLCIILLLRKKRDNSRRQRHGSRLHLHLVRSLGDINNSMLQMAMEHRRSMSYLMDRVAGLEEQLKPGEGYRSQRYENRETPSITSRVSADNISQNDSKLAEEKDHRLSQENKQLQAVINSLQRQNEELTKRLEDMTETVPLLEDHVANKDCEIAALKDRLNVIERCASDDLQAAEFLNSELFNVLNFNEQITEANTRLQQQLTAEIQSTGNVTKLVWEFEDAVGAMKASLLRDRQLSDPLNTKLFTVMEQLLSETQGFRTRITKTYSD